MIKAPERKDELLGTAFFLRITGSAAALFLIAMVTSVTENESSTRMIIIICGLSGLFQSFYVVDYYFQSRVLAKYSAVVLFSSLLISSAAKIILILVKAPLIYFAAASSFDFFIAGINFLIAYKIIGFRISDWKFRQGIAFSLLKDSWPLMLSVLAITIYMKIDQVIIRNMLDDKQVGYYAAAVRLTEAWYFIPAAIVTSLFPAILNAKQADERIYMNRLQKLYDLLVMIAVAIALPVTIFSKEIIVILLGSDFINSAPVLTIYIWGSIAVFLGIASGQYLVAENFTRISFYRTLAGVVINVALNFALIPVIGILGSALATLFSYTLSVLSISLNKKTSNQFGMMLKAIFMVNILKFAYKKVVR